jgi:hypothetical protein
MTYFIATFVGICFAMWVRRRSLMRAALDQSASYDPDPRELPRSAGQPVATLRLEKGTVDFSIATPRANNPRQPNKIVDRSSKKRQAPWHDIKHIPKHKSGHSSPPSLR